MTQYSIFTKHHSNFWSEPKRFQVWCSSKSTWNELPNQIYCQIVISMLVSTTLLSAICNQHVEVSQHVVIFKLKTKQFPKLKNTTSVVDPVEKSPGWNGVFFITTAIFIVFIIIITIAIIVAIIIIVIHIIIIIIFIIIILLTLLFCLYHFKYILFT